MRYRLTVLGLAAVLGILPALTITPAAAPAPQSSNQPKIYALIYVGLGNNHPDNGEQRAAALRDLCGSAAHRAVRDPKVNALPIVQDQEKKLGRVERDKWAESKTRTASLEGTAAVRVWFADGTPEEQVAIINAIAREYVKERQEFLRKALKDHETDKAKSKAQRERAGANVAKEDERVFQRKEEMLKHPPHILEWACLPEKP